MKTQETSNLYTVSKRKKSRNGLLSGLMAAFACVGSFSAFGQTDPKNAAPKENDYYKMITLPVPENILLEVGGLVTLPNGDLAVSTRRGEVWMIKNPYMENGTMPYFSRFANGLHEILGLAYKDGALLMAQRGELTRLRDKNGDGKADSYETVFAWPLSGHYHEYSFGPKLAPDGSMFVTGNVAFGDVEWWRGESRVPWRGWTMKISPDGQMTPYATGMRSPCGIGLVDGEFFYADNQGDWMGSGGVVHVEKGDFTGHPAGLRWATRPDSPVKLTTNDIYSRVDPRMAKPGENPIKPENDPKDKGTPLFELAKDLPAIKTPAVWLPHSILGISTSEILVNTGIAKGSFGPFEGQLFVGDQGQSKIDRVFLEKVNGKYQGAAFAFREGFQSGVLRMAWGKDGSMFVGETNRGWGSAGDKDYGLQRLVWTGKTPFEMKAIRAMPDGFEVEFTLPVDKKTASNPASYEVTGFIYKYHPVYGSPVINDKVCTVKGVVVSEDGMRARIVVDGLREKYIHEVKANNVLSQSGLPLLHSVGYYTLNSIPSGEKLTLLASHTGANHDHSMMAAGTTKTPAKTATKETGTTKSPATTTGASVKRLTKMPASWGGKADQTIEIGTVPGLKYDKAEITVKAGSKVQWTFGNNDDMPHNCVIVSPGQAIPVGELAMKLGLKGQEMDYIPATPKVLFHTKLMQPATSEAIYFIAPAPGVYTYVCTVPGHAYVMQGTLKVVK
jgi:plastocyanin